jgi:hypothetical protein
MIFFIKKAVVAATFAVCLAGCVKPDNSAQNIKMTAKINDSSFFGANCYYLISGDITSIYGYSGASSTTTYYPEFILEFSSPIKAGNTYSIDGIAVKAFLDSDVNTTDPALSGSVGISSVSATQISGTFSFTCTDSTVVSGGTFTAKKM